jgi:hypothetical protein
VVVNNGQSLGYRIKASGIERVTTDQTANGQQSAAQWSVLLDGLQRIL